jgi:hypothetical protein
MGKEDVSINGRSVVHAGDGQTNACATPDVCKTPSPGGPVPIPYVNVARDADLAHGSHSVFIGGNAIALKDSDLSTSTGDEPGTAGGGIVSAKTKGKMSWSSSSIDVKFEGKGVIRFLDATLHNGNSSNASFAQNGRTENAYGDDHHGSSYAEKVCDRCSHKKNRHRLHEHDDSRSLANQLMARLESVRQLHAVNALKRSELQVLRRHDDGYMIGVLICTDNSVFASMSGKHTPGFKLAVEKSQVVDSVKGYSQALPDFLLGGRVSKVNYAEAIPPTPEVVHLGEGKALTSPEAIREFFAPIADGYNPPFNCAAPRAIQCALKQGKTPLYLTEMWYAPVGKRDKSTRVAQVVSVTHARTERRGSAMHFDPKHAKTFSHGEVVPSCDTCKKHLTSMLCIICKNCINEKSKGAR